MMYKLNEDNKSINKLIKYIDSKIIKLKNENIGLNILEEIQQLYIDVINPWMVDNYLLQIEPNSKEEEQLTNALLELIQYINKLQK